MNELKSEPTKSVLSGIFHTPSKIGKDGVIELGNFDYEGFQVVRREFIGHANEPSITFNNEKIYVNAACLNKFQYVDYVQMLVNQFEKMLLIRPSREEERDAFHWCVPGAAQRKPRQIGCRLFFAKMFTMMGWNFDYRYKLLGKVMRANDEYLIGFDLTATEVYQRVSKDGGKPKTSRIPVYPEDWKEQFGVFYGEHRKSMQVNVFDGYAVYSIKENKIVSTEDISAIPMQGELSNAGHGRLPERLSNEQ